MKLLIFTRVCSKHGNVIILSDVSINLSNQNILIQQNWNRSFLYYRNECMYTKTKEITLKSNKWILFKLTVLGFIALSHPSLETLIDLTNSEILIKHSDVSTRRLKVD